VGRGQRSAVDEHLPEHRADLRHRSREHWVERARRIGEEAERLVEAIFKGDDVLLELRPVPGGPSPPCRMPWTWFANCPRPLQPLQGGSLWPN